MICKPRDNTILKNEIIDCPRHITQIWFLLHFFSLIISVVTRSTSCRAIISTSAEQSCEIIFVDLHEFGNKSLKVEYVLGSLAKAVIVVSGPPYNLCLEAVIEI